MIAEYRGIDRHSVKECKGNISPGKWPIPAEESYKRSTNGDRVRESKSINGLSPAGIGPSIERNRKTKVKGRRGETFRSPRPLPATIRRINVYCNSNHVCRNSNRYSHSIGLPGSSTVDHYKASRRIGPATERIGTA